MRIINAPSSSVLFFIKMSDYLKEQRRELVTKKVGHEHDWVEQMRPITQHNFNQKVFSLVRKMGDARDRIESLRAQMREESFTPQMKREWTLARRAETRAFRELNFTLQRPIIKPKGN